MVIDKARRISNLDIIKIVAAICIVFHHYQQLSHSHFSYINFFDGRFPFGNLVELFFMISGFLTAMTFCYQKGIIKNLCYKAARILPMSFISVVACGLILYIHYAITGTLLFNARFGRMQILTSMLLLNQGWAIEYFPAINNPIWYLCVLMLIETIYVLVATAAKNNRVIISAVAFAFVVLGYYGYTHGLSYPFLYQSDFRGYAPFFIGVLIAFILNQDNRKIFLGISILVLIGSISFYIILKSVEWRYLVFFTYPALVTCAVSLPQIKNNKLSFWGGVTYETYLWHVPIFCLFKSIVEANSIHLKHSYITMLLFTLFVIAVSVLCYKYLEIPIYRKIKLFINKL